jgi:hypothetical protein
MITEMKILAEIKRALHAQSFRHNPNFRDHGPPAVTDVTGGMRVNNIHPADGFTLGL